MLISVYRERSFPSHVIVAIGDEWWSEGTGHFLLDAEDLNGDDVQRWRIAQ
ncbi:hypothetical protein IPZ61_01570 [Streptomyces sioyaensis]|uniref:hypothetical protein n=1 Tax=Streptomyces sioyaensis TaxID=67364 RepID=UPI001F44AC1A|nr:hypothetical protein [Streptomyces sioyaensis]MCF3172030.1 hypothetical protein [Streptomyces sioyaensis]